MTTHTKGLRLEGAAAIAAADYRSPEFLLWLRYDRDISGGQVFLAIAMLWQDDPAKAAVAADKVRRSLADFSAWCKVHDVADAAAGRAIIDSQATPGLDGGVQGDLF